MFAVVPKLFRIRFVGHGSGHWQRSSPCRYASRQRQYVAGRTDQLHPTKALRHHGTRAPVPGRRRRDIDNSAPELCSFAARGASLSAPRFRARQWPGSMRWAVPESAAALSPTGSGLSAEGSCPCAAVPADFTGHQRGRDLRREVPVKCVRTARESCVAGGLAIVCARFRKSEIRKALAAAGPVPFREGRL